MSNDAANATTTGSAPSAISPGISLDSATRSSFMPSSSMFWTNSSSTFTTDMASTTAPSGSISLSTSAMTQPPIM